MQYLGYYPTIYCILLGRILKKIPVDKIPKNGYTISYPIWNQTILEAKNPIVTQSKQYAKNTYIFLRAVLLYGILRFLYMKTEQKKNPHKGKTILVVHAGSAKKKFIFKKLKRLGLTIVCINKEKVDVLDPYIDHWILADLMNHHDSMLALENFIRKHPLIHIDGAVTFWDDVVTLTSRITDHLKLIGIPLSISEQVRNKFRFRDFCKTHNIPTPKFTHIQSKAEITKIEKKMNYPLVIKPVYGNASVFVIKVTDRKDFEETFDYIKNSIKSSVDASEFPTFELLVEEYVDGDEVDVDVVLQNGKVKFISVADNFNKNKGKFFVDSGQSLPSLLPKEDCDALERLTEDLLEKLNIYNAIVHFEAKVTNNGIYPIECNLRMGGDYIYSYLKDAWHVDFVEQAVNIALGIFIPKIAKKEEPYEYVIGWDLQIDVSGILTSLTIDEEFHKLPFVTGSYISKSVGDVVLRPPEGYDTMGWITVSGTNTLDAEDNLQVALSHIHYTITEFDTESSLGKTIRNSNLSAAVVKTQQLIKAAKIERVRTADSRQEMRKLHIGIAGNRTHGQRKKHGADSLVLNHIEKSLRQAGYKITEFDFNNIPELLQTLPTSGVDLMFNTTEGIGQDTTLLPQAAALIEAFHMPITGTSSYNLALCKDKIRVKKLFEYHDIPTPKWDYMRTIDDTFRSDLRFPMIVKPGAADDSLGITNASIVRTKKELLKQARHIIETLHMPALIEEYIDGEEYEVSIIGNFDIDLQVLPLTKMNAKKNKHAYNIVTAETSKLLLRPHAVAASKKLDTKQSQLITEIALDAYRITRCHDYGYVGIRIDTHGNPYVLEVDPNPPLYEYSDFMVAAKLMGLTYTETVEKIIYAAVQRYKKTKQHLIWM